VLREIVRVVLDPAEQRRSPGVLPRQAEEVQARRGGDAALVHDLALAVEHGQVNPTVVEAESGCPDQGVDGQLGPVREADGPLGNVRRPWFICTPWRLTARGFEPISVSRPLSFCPSRESTAMFSSLVLLSHQNRSRPASF
jgi:hypothetical protein